MPVHIGTSGWVYQDWRGLFYPKGLRQKDELAYYAERFATVEINSTFYRLPKAETMETWADSVPDDFVFAPKVSQFLSHRKRLKEPQEPVERFMDRVGHLRSKLGPALLQLPGNFKRNDERLREALTEFGGRARVAVEFRDESWYTDEVFDLLRKHDAALCLADREEEWVTPVEATADWAYMRFHWGQDEIPSGYREHTLRRRAEELAGLLKQGADVFVYFNNDPGACAIRDAITFAGFIREAGLEPTRVPGRDEVEGV